MIQSEDLVPDANLLLCHGFPDDLDDNLFSKGLEQDFYGGYDNMAHKEYQPVQQMEDYKNKRWSSDDVASDGYGSDPGSQSSPAPSPYSVMDASGASPHGTSFSPPPSNLSADSGVNSPMADDNVSASHLFAHHRSCGPLVDTTAPLLRTRVWPILPNWVHVFTDNKYFCLGPHTFIFPWQGHLFTSATYFASKQEIDLTA